jgi:uncharacterized protein with HEPN domain
MIDAIGKTVGLTEGKTRDLEKNEMLTLSLVRLLEIVGEAADVSEGFRKEHPDIPWRSMVGIRNRLIHGYFDVDLDIVWDTARKDLPPIADGS